MLLAVSYRDVPHGQPGVRSSRDNVASSCTEGDGGREAQAATPSIQGVGNQDRAVRSTQVKCC
jgi:hypothetical protein